MIREKVTRHAQEKTFKSHDGIELFYRYWPAPKPKGAIVLFHRGHEHSGRLQHIVDELQLPDFDFFAWDARGHGRSPGERGDSPSVYASVRDVDCFIKTLSCEYSIAEENIFVIAQSVGAVLVSTWVHDYAPRIRGIVLASPAFSVKLYVPFARKLLALRQKIQGRFFVNSYVKAKFLTHDPQRIASYNADPLVSRPIASHILLSLFETAKRVVDDADAIVVPTQIVISGADFVVHQRPQHDFFVRLGSSDKERHLLTGFYHDTLGEKDRILALNIIRKFIIKLYECPYKITDLTQSDKKSFTRTEADQLATPLSIFSARGAYWGLVRFSLQVGALFSKGIKLGRQTGFDSGSTLDYVYQNRAQGLTSFGVWLDKLYLNSIGWRGIRQRKIHIEELIQVAIGQLREKGRRVDIMDIAAGHGRYILEAIEANHKSKPDSIILRDYSDINVEKGRQLAKDKGLDDITQFVKADAFSLESYPGGDNAMTLGVVSGLYELFADNDLIRTSLQGLAATIEAGGYLIYTGQPWHPQLEMIARALTSHRQGQAWVMRRRSQAEIDQLVAAAGFTKIDQRIDEHGIFTVSIAEKNT